MKNMVKGLFTIALLCSAVSAQAEWGRSYFLGANTGAIAGGGLFSSAGKTHRFDADAMYGKFDVTLEYAKSLKSGDLGKYLSPINNKTFRVGAQNNTAGGNTTDVQNLMFLLDDTYDATITFKPEVKTFTANLGLFVGLNEFWEGLWLDFNLPIVHNKRHVKMTETQNTAAADAVTAASAYANGAQSTIPYTTFKAALVGNLGSDAAIAANNLPFAKVDGPRSHTKVGNVTVALGYDFMNKENMHLGVGLVGLLNGGSKSDAVYMFEPAVGTAGRHGIGAKVDGHIRLYEQDDSELNAYLTANLTHLFDSTVLRTYDFTRHGKWSRYMLYKNFSTNGFGANAATLVRGASFSTLKAKVGMDLMYDLNMMLRYTNGAFCGSFSYGIYGHSKEEHKKWVDSFTTTNYGAWSLQSNMVNGGTAQQLSTNVTINGGTAAGLNTDTPAAAAANVLTRDGATGLDKNSGLNPSALVHRIAGDLSYCWADTEWEPHLGIGGGADLSSSNKGLSQWNIHVHGGVGF